MAHVQHADLFREIRPLRVIRDSDALYGRTRGTYVCRVSNRAAQDMSVVIVTTPSAQSASPVQPAKIQAN